MKITFWLENEFKRVWVLVALKSHAVIFSWDSHDFRNVLDRQSKSEWFMTTVVTKSLFFEKKGDTGNMARIHSFNGQTIFIDLDVNQLNYFFKWVSQHPKDRAFFESCFEHQLRHIFLILKMSCKLAFPKI
jgi:hypothetical protein